MKDLSLPNYTSSKIADRILEGKISFETITASVQYEEMIRPRLEALIHIKESLDNEFTLYSYLPRVYPFYTNIKADYLIASSSVTPHFIFIIRANEHGNLKYDFSCCSIFKKGIRDYEKNQHAYTLLRKERIHIPTNSSSILLDRLHSSGSFSL